MNREDNLFDTMGDLVGKLRGICLEPVGSSRLLGVAAKLDGRPLFEVNAHLSDEEGACVLAHEIAHWALGHLKRKTVQLKELESLGERWRNGGAEVKKGLGKEELADIWAAHLLVNPKVYEENLSCEGDPESARRATARQLNIPMEAVLLWEQTKDCARDLFGDELPREWAARHLGREFNYTTTKR